ncbi:MAG: MFS transporter [Cyanobacteria bacterium CRU_2_1]|nr:MFS transporter [Cyanobacteria bacterium CRU_2_1]
MSTFILIWFGQLLSIVGSGMTGFALGVWTYQNTGSVTELGLIYFFTELPAILVAPLAGAIADQFDRRWVMIVSNVGAGMSTLAIALLMVLGNLESWHIYLAMAISSTCKGFLAPAYYAATTLLVPKQHFGRAGGMIQLGVASERLFSPILAGALIAISSIHNVIAIDCLTFLVALCSLLIIRFPQPPKLQANPGGKGSLWRESAYGWNYIAARPGLLIMTIFFAITNFTVGIAQVLVTPMVLSFANPQVLSQILSIGGSGWLFGSLTMSVWGGAKRRINATLGFELLLGLGIVAMGLRPDPVLITMAVFVGFFSIPIIVGTSNAIWQVKVAPEVQGRVFAMRGALSWSSFPLAYLVAGPLADRIFEPMMMNHGFLAQCFGAIVGVGQGRGIALLFVFVGLFVILVTIAAYQYPPLRCVEHELPDFVSL